jgi:hypothetical protein
VVEAEWCLPGLLPVLLGVGKHLGALPSRKTLSAVAVTLGGLRKES